MKQDLDNIDLCTKNDKYILNCMLFLHCLQQYYITFYYKTFPSTFSANFPTIRGKFVTDSLLPANPRQIDNYIEYKY